MLGCSGSYGSPDEACSGYLVQSASTNIWIDCGPGTLGALQRHVQLADLDAIVVSHQHPDHCAELPVVYNAAKYYEGLTTIPVICTEGVRTVTDAFHPMNDSSDLFAWEIVSDSSRARVGDIDIVFSRTDHPVETLAMRFEHAGKAIVYTSDTGPGWSLAALGPDPDLVVGEGTLLETDFTEGVPHITCSDLGRDAASVGAGHLVVTHVPPGGDPDVHRAEAARSFGGPVSAAHGGACYTV